MALYKISQQRRDKDKKPPFGARLNFHHPLSQGLTAAWLLNEGSGQNVYDSSGQQCHGILDTSRVLWSSTVMGNAMYFFGSYPHGFVDIGVPPAIVGLVVPMTLIGSFITTTTSGNQSIIGQYLTASNHQLIKMVRIDSGNLTYYYGKSDGGYSSYGSLSVTANLLTNYCVVVSGSLSTPTCDIYVNNSHISSSILPLTATPDTSVHIYLGSDTINYDPLQGWINYQYIYNRSLSSGEVYELFANPYQMFIHPVWDAYFVPAAAPPPTGGKSIFGYDSIFHAGGIIQT